MDVGDPVKVGQVFQLHPEKTKNKMFSACLFVVTEIKSFGAQGYVQALGQNMEPGGQAYYRATPEELVPLIDGHVQWMPGEHDV